MTTYETLSVVISALGFGGVIWGVFVAKGQLKKMAEAGLLSAVDTQLNLESRITENKLRLDEVAISVTELMKSNPKQQDVTVAQLKLNSAVENYLNALDRLSANILRGYIQEKEYKIDYRDVINSAVENYSEHFKGVQRKFRNVLDIYDKWKQE